MPRRGHDRSDNLFSEYNLYDVQESQREKLKRAINDASPSLIQGGTVEDVASAFVEQFSLDVPELTEGAISVEAEEAQVDVSGDRERAFIYGHFGSGSYYVPGIRVSYFVPFTGDRNLFRVQPNTYSSQTPVADVSDNELRLNFERADQNVGETKKAFDSELSNIKQYLGWLREGAKSFNSSLTDEAQQLVRARRERLSQLHQGANSLGIPIRSATNASPTAAPARPTPPSRPSTPGASGRPKMYDVALSFAGENRAYVEQVAKGLQDAGVEVFYDDFEKVSLWGKNLVDHLADIYQHRSRYVVMFVSQHYVEKAWPSHERHHAQARALVAKEEYILPARFDDTPVPGMTDTVGYVDLRTTSANDFVALILAKLGRVTKA